MASKGGRRLGAAALGAGFIVCGLGVLAAVLVWPATRWIGTIADLSSPYQLILTALANAVFLVGCYVAIAAPLWGIADALMGAPQDLPAFDKPDDGARTWRVAHLSDLHSSGNATASASKRARRTARQ